MPVHNGATYLSKAVQSILNQTFPDFELLILDDGSTDDSAVIAHRHADTDPRVRVIQLDRVGLTRALNLGLESARAPWIARMDADDIAHPTRFQRQMEFLVQRPDVAVLGTHAWMIGRSGKIVGKSTQGPTSRDAFLQQREDVRINFVHPTVMYSRRVVMEAGGYSDDYPAAEDFELWNRLAEEHYMLSLPEPLLYYRVHDAATGTRALRVQAESWSCIRENMKRQRLGLAPISVEEHRMLRKNTGLGNRLRRDLKLRSRYCYRKGGAKIAAGNATGVGWLMLSAMLYLPVPLARIQNQVLRPMRQRIDLSSRIRRRMRCGIASVNNRDQKGAS